MIFSLISISITGNVLLLVVLILVCIFLSFYFYKFTIPRLNKKNQFILTFLRALILIILCWLLFEPILLLIKKIVEKPTIAILIDDTRSVSIQKNSASQLNELRKFINSGILERKFSDFDFYYYSFSTKLKRYDNFNYDSISFTGEATNISTALEDLKNENKNFVLTILISDGNYNSGKSPIYAAENLNMPIVTIGIGDTVYQRDIMVWKVVTNEVVYAGNKIPVEATLKWHGFNNEKTELILSENENILDRQIIIIDEGEVEKKFKLNYIANETGMRRFNVSVSNLPDELTTNNNYKSVFVNVLKSKLRIMLIAGAPSPDVSAINYSLNKNENFNLYTFVQKNDREFYPHYKNGKIPQHFSENMLDTMDCLIFVNFPNSVTRNDILYQIKIRMENKKIPLLYIAGKDIDYIKLQNYDFALPFSWVNINLNETVVYPILNGITYSSIILDNQLTREVYKKLPPIYKQLTKFKSKAESEVLANVMYQNVVSDEPLFLSRNILRQKSFAILGYGIWRWNLLSSNDPDTEKFLNKFLSNIINWLTILDEQKKVKVIPTKLNFTTADMIEFNGQVYDDQYRPIDNADIHVKISSVDENFELLLENVGNGRYEGKLHNMIEGDYIYYATAHINENLVGVDSGKFSVGKINLEYLDTKMNKSLLQQIAVNTGGKYIQTNQLDELDQFLSIIKSDARETKLLREYKIWDAEIVVLLLIFLLSIEWYLRKRKGLL